MNQCLLRVSITKVIHGSPRLAIIGYYCQSYADSLLSAACLSFQLSDSHSDNSNNSTTLFLNHFFHPFLFPNSSLSPIKLELTLSYLTFRISIKQCSYCCCNKALSGSWNYLQNFWHVFLAYTPVMTFFVHPRNIVPTMLWQHNSN